MSKREEKKKAIEMRRQGLSVNVIAGRVGASKSSVSMWVRDVLLTEKQREHLRDRMIGATEAGRLRGAAWNKQQRLNRLAIYVKSAAGIIPSLSLQDLFFLGLGLYWGEGFKSRSGSAGFSNSDPRVVQLMILWLEQCMGVSRDRLRIQIFINDIHRDREAVIKKFWERTTGFKKEQFRKIIFLPKARKVYENRETYYGVCAIRILKGTEVKDKVNALIQRSFDVHRQCRPT